MNLRSVLLELVGTRGGADAILAPGRASLTFSGLAYRTEVLKDQLNSLGIGRGDRVVAVLPNGPEMAVCYLAVATFATFVPLNPGFRQDEFETYLKRLNPRAVIVPEQGGTVIRAACANMGLPLLVLTVHGTEPAGTFALRGERIGACRQPGWNHGDDIVLILPTSGSTGRPKLVPLPDHHQLRYGRELQKWFDIGPEDRSLHFMPMFHGHGLNSSLMCSIVSGTSIVCLPRFDVEEFFEAMRVYQPTWYSAGFSYHRAILEGSANYREIAARSRLRFIRSGSGRLDLEILQGLEDLFGAPVIERYGMSEANTIAANPLPPRRRKPGTVGLPIHSRVAIRGDDGRALKQGEIGEIVVPDDLVFPGYLDDPDANAKAFVDGWFRTGDLGFFDTDGYLTITGRVDDVINCGGEKISPAEVDAALMAHPAVAQAVTFPVSHPTLGQIPVAAVVTSTEATDFSEQLREFLRGHIGEFKIPRRFFFMENIPLGATGKITRNELAELVTVPASDTKIAELKRSSSEADQLTGSEVAIAEGPTTLDELIREVAARTPDSPAILSPDRAPLTFIGLERHIAKVGAKLNQFGLGRQDRIALICSSAAEAMVAFLCIGSAATVIPLDPKATPEEREAMLASSGADAAVISDDLREIQDEVRGRDLPVIRLLPCEELETGVFDLLGETAENVRHPWPATSSDIAVIYLTSGTVGRPKAVPLSHECVVRRAFCEATILGLTGRDRCLNFREPHLMGTLSVGLITPLCVGGSVVITDGFDADAFFRILSELKFTWYTGGPVYHESILAQADQYREIIEGSPLRLIRSATYSLAPHLMEQLEATLGVICLERYGGTEAGLITCNPPPPGRRKPGTAGLPFDNEVRIIDENGNRLPWGEEGEIIVRGPNVFTGYLDPATGQESTFLEGWYRTGDLGRFDQDGYLKVNGRIREVINRGGQKVLPSEVEAVIKEHAAVSDCVCFPMPHQTLGETVAAAITVKEGQKVDEPEIQEFLKNRISDFKIPDRVLQCGEIPHGPNGKIQRTRMAEHFGLTESLFQPQNTAAPELAKRQRPALLRTLASLWCDVLRIDDIKDDDNFILLGGDSLRAARLLIDVQEVFGISLPEDIIYRKGRTLIGMANAITDARKELLESQGDTSIVQQVQIPKRDASQPCPLTFSQQRLWFLSKFDVSGDLYNLPGAVKLKGRIEPAILRQALNFMVARHEALRASFPDIDGVPQQVFAPTLVLDMPITDLRSMSSADQELELKRLISAEAAQPFSLDHGPLIRSRLVLMSGQESVLLLPQHHLISDGLSTEIFFRELMKCYGDLANRKPISLPPVSVQFGDFATWQRQQLQGVHLETLRSHWKRYLDDAPLVLDLPFDRPRPSVQSYRGSRILIEIPERLVEGLRAVSARSGASLFHGALAAFEVLIHRLSGHEDFIIGTAINDRKQGLTDSTIGFFVNTLPLRAKCNDDLTFSEHLKTVCEAAVEAQKYGDMPFEQIVEELNPPRDAGCQPIVQVLFGFMPRDRRVFKHAGIEFEQIDIDLKITRFDLSIMMSEGRGILDGIVDFSTDLFDRETVVRFLKIFERLLEQIVEAPDRQIGDFQLVSKAKKKKLLEEWSGITTPYPSNSSIPQVFADITLHQPDAVALSHDEYRVTYGVLDQWSDRLAHRLIQAGVSTGEVVAISAERTPALIAGLLAILKAGGAYLALDPSLPEHRIRLILEDAKVASCLVQEGSRVASALEGVSVIGLADDGSDLDDQPTAPIMASIPPDGLAYVSYTSGSTGQPKGVSVPHRAVLRLVKNTNYAQFGPNERFLQLANVAFDASTFEIWGCLLNGGTLVQAPIETPSLSELATLIEEREITTLWLTAGLFHQMVEHELPCFSNVRQVLAGGDVLSPSHVRRFLQGAPNCRLINGYGPTENTTFTCTYSVSDEGDISGSVPIGRPIANTQVYILDKKLNPVPVGVEGELFAAGDGLALGYLNQPDLTAERFLPNPYDPRPGAKMYRTGDRARFLANGLIEFIGRVDDQVKIRGFRVEPGEVEAVLAEHPLLAQAAVVAKTDAQRGTSLVAYMVPRDGSEPPDDQNMRSFLAARLPSYMVPSAFVHLKNMPLTKNGKVDRNKLQATTQIKVNDARPRILPRTPVEQILGDIWCDLLGIKEIGIDDDFFQLGGHSLLATQLIYRIAKETQEDLPLSTIFQNSTIRSLALLITERLLAEAHADEATGLGAS